MTSAAPGLLHWRRVIRSAPKRSRRRSEIGSATCAVICSRCARRWPSSATTSSWTLPCGLLVGGSVELNRVKAVERGVDQLYNYIAELAAFGLELAELRGRRDETNARVISTR